MTTFLKCLDLYLPYGVVSSAQIDEEVPGPVAHGQQILHALQVHAEKTSSAPDCCHAPVSHTDIWVVLSQL